MTRQRGSTEAIIISILTVALIAALGFVFWQNFLQKDDGSNQNMHNASSSVDAENEQSDTIPDNEQEISETGSIVGSLTYPSHGIPPTLEVHAINLATSQVYSTKERLQGDHYRYHVGYKLDVPAGEYHVYSTHQETPDQRHYYNRLVDACNSISAGCDDPTAKIVVTVEPGKETKDIMAGWSMPCVVPGGTQPTEKFDLPTC